MLAKPRRAPRVESVRYAANCAANPPFIYSIEAANLFSKTILVNESSERKHYRLLLSTGRFVTAWTMSSSGD